MMKRHLPILAVLALAPAVLGLLGAACSTPGPEAGITAEQLRERRISMGFTAAHLMITDLQLRDRISNEKAADLRRFMDHGRACLRHEPACGLFQEGDPLAELDLVKRALAGDVLAQLDLAEEVLDRLNDRLQRADE